MFSLINQLSEHTINALNRECDFFLSATTFELGVRYQNLISSYNIIISTCCFFLFSYLPSRLVRDTKKHLNSACQCERALKNAQYTTKKNPHSHQTNHLDHSISHTSSAQTKQDN